jgi:uncharacterized membrane protein
VDHFAIALPVVILLLELMNLILRKRAISGVSLFLILLTVVVTVGAYFTGLVDGKEAFPALSDAAKEELGEHKLLGTYLMLASFVLLFFKLFSMLSAKAIMKGLYLLVLIAFVAGIFKQGEEGGELVYEYGINVEKVKELDDKIFDLEEALEEAEEKADAVKEESASEEVETVPALSEPAATPVETTPVEMPSTSEPETVPTETTAPEAAPVQTESVDAVKETTIETLRTEVEEAAAVGEKYEEMVQPEIATH